MKRKLMGTATTILIALAGLFGIAAPAQAAPTYEWNTAVAATAVPAGIPCVEMQGSLACWQSNGDTLWIADVFPGDGYSATASWSNWQDGRMVRQGSCVNKLGSGHWGRCAKNFVEDTSIRLYACVYDAANNIWHGCSTDKWVTA